MLRSVVPAAAAALSALLVTSVVAQNLPDLEGRTIVAVTENAFVPLNFVDQKTGAWIGLEYDLVNEIAARVKAKVEWRTSAWDVMLQGVRDGQYDMAIDGISVNPERAQIVDFSDPYLTSEQVMLVRSDEARFTDAVSFRANEPLLIGTQAGTTNFYVAIYDVLDGNEANPRVRLFDTFGTSVEALRSGDVDLVLMDSSGVEGYLGANPGAFKVVGTPLGTDSFAIALQKGSDLLTPVNAALAQMAADDTLDLVRKRWYVDYKVAP